MTRFAVAAQASREPLIDALRALALLGVLVVNAMSYPGSPAGSPLGEPAPPGSVTALAAFTAVAWLVQGKAYPLLAFLFGYSLALALARRDVGAQAYRRRRMLRLLLLGVLHGTLLYAGDILTAYSLAGLGVLGLSRLPLRRLLAAWRFVAALALGLVAMNVTLLLTGAVQALGSSVPAGYASTAGMGGFLRLNVADYLGALPGVVLYFLPEVLMLVLGGFIAGRLRWLTHPRWEAVRRKLWLRLLPAALVLNLAYAIFMAWAASNESPLQWVGLSAGPVAGWLLAAAAAQAVATWWHTRRPVWLRRLVPLGRCTLSLYVGHSLLCALFFSGAGLGWPLGTREALAWALGLWLVCVWLAGGLIRRGLRGPLEAWVARA